MFGIIASPVLGRLLRSDRPATVKFESAYKAKGYLTLGRSGSTACPGEPGNPDPNLEEFSLPVAVERDQCLPGAPAAYRANRTKYYSDVSKLAAGYSETKVGPGCSR